MERFLYIDTGVGPILIPLGKIRCMASNRGKNDFPSASIFMDAINQKQVTWTADHSIDEIAEAIYLTPPDQPLIRVSQKPFPQKQGAK